MYADYEYYTDTYGGSILTKDTAAKALSQASSDIDILTFNRIHAHGFDSLSDFIKGHVRYCVCALADFREQNNDAMDNVYKSYSVNGVSLIVGSNDTVQVVSGVMIPREVYSLLVSTGLCYRGGV